MKDISLRYKVSNAVNALTYTLIKNNKIIIGINHKFYNCTVFLKRFQLIFIERLFIDSLFEEQRIPNEYFLIEKRPYIKTRTKVVNNYEKINTRVTRYLFKFISKYKSKTTVFKKDLKRIYLVDAGEIKLSMIGGKKYYYHKYLEGILDFDSMDFGSQTLVVLYGDVEKIGWERILNPNLILLNDYYNELIFSQDLVTEYNHSLFYEDILKSYKKTFSHYNGQGDTNNQAHGKYETSNIINEYLLENTAYFQDILSSDFAIISAVENLLRHIGHDLEIYLDNYDSTLFSLSQFILSNYNHKVVALQKVLGPYIFSFNINGHEGLFKQPSKMLVWSNFHKKNVINLGYTCEFEVLTSYKFKKYKTLKNVDCNKIRKDLSIPDNKKIIMFSAVRNILSYSLIDKPIFHKLLFWLNALCKQNKSIFILFKPWPGENQVNLSMAVNYIFEDNNSFLIFDHKLAQKIHNIELLSITDIMISTLSSFIGEAIFFDVLPVFINYKSCQDYFSQEYSDEFKQICFEVNESTEFPELMEKVVNFTEKEKQEFFKRTEKQYKYLFGNTDRN